MPARPSLSDEFEYVDYGDREETHRQLYLKRKSFFDPELPSGWVERLVPSPVMQADGRTGSHSAALALIRREFFWKALQSETYPGKVAEGELAAKACPMLHIMRGDSVERVTEIIDFWARCTFLDECRELEYSMMGLDFYMVCHSGNAPPSLPDRGDITQRTTPDYDGLESLAKEIKKSQGKSLPEIRLRIITEWQRAAMLAYCKRKFLATERDIQDASSAIKHQDSMEYWKTLQKREAGIIRSNDKVTSQAFQLHLDHLNEDPGWHSSCLVLQKDLRDNVRGKLAPNTRGSFAKNFAKELTAVGLDTLPGKGGRNR